LTFWPWNWYASRI